MRVKSFISGERPNQALEPTASPFQSLWISRFVHAFRLSIVLPSSERWTISLFNDINAERKTNANRTKAQNMKRDIKPKMRELTDEELANVTGGDSAYLNPDGTEVEIDLEGDVAARNQVKSSPSKTVLSPFLKALQNRKK